MPSQRIDVQPHVSIWSDLLGIDLRQRMVDAGGVRTRVLEAGELGEISSETARS